MIPGPKAWAIVFALSSTPAWAIAAPPPEVLAAISADDGRYDLRDEQNRPVEAPTVKEELRQASVQYQFQAMFGVDLPRASAARDLLAQLTSFLMGLAAPILPIFGFDGLAPPTRTQSRPFEAGNAALLAPLLFGCLALLRVLMPEQSSRIPLVLRC